VGQRISLDDLPTWAQDLILNTAAGLLEDPTAHAEEMDSGGGFWIKAHGFTYAARKGAERVF
jgi:hypothetical protein